MTQHHITPDDPRLTAYALGELDPAQAAAITEAVAQDPALATEVEAIRALGGELTEALQTESLPAVDPVELPESLGGERIEFPMGRAASKTFPYYWISGLAAAGFAVLIVTQSPESPLVGREEVAQQEEPFRITVVDAEDLPPMTNAAPAPTTERLATVPENPHIEPAPQAMVLGDSVGSASEPEVLNSVGVNEPVFDNQVISSAAAAKQRPTSDNTLLNSSAVVSHASDAIAQKDEEVITLSAFEVTSDDDMGYMATSTVAGTALRNDLRARGNEQSRQEMQFSAFSSERLDTEGYALIEEQGWKQVGNAPLSTFGVDVDTASYANVRRFLRRGSLPPVDAVKIEELVNAFTYDYTEPSVGTDAPLQANLEVAAAPWAPQHRLVRIGLKAREMAQSERAPANLVFLLDVSGSMNSPQKLPLVKEAMRLLLGQLHSDDRVAIVTYAGNSGLALPSTPVAQRREITAALDNLRAGGSTHGSSGIHLAYDVAKANFIDEGVNRVILCTDGDFNVGTTGLGELERLIADKAESGVYLTGLGFGTGNYQDDTLETLANRGNGTHGYIDSVREARRLLVEQVTGTLTTVAQDVKIQVEFNPAQVAAYRLLGYNNRRLTAEEFNDDSVDAGEIGAGHTVTALYEVVPVGAELPEEPSSVDALRYQQPVAATTKGEHADELLLVKVRAQPPGGGESRLHIFPLVDQGHGFESASPDFKFAAAVAAFGLELREMTTARQYAWTEVGDWARAGIVDDPGGYRREFLDLVQRAAELSAP